MIPRDISLAVRILGGGAPWCLWGDRTIASRSVAAEDGRARFGHVTIQSRDEVTRLTRSEGWGSADAPRQVLKRESAFRGRRRGPLSTASHRRRAPAQEADLSGEPSPRAGVERAGSTRCSTPSPRHLRALMAALIAPSVSSISSLDGRCIGAQRPLNLRMHSPAASAGATAP